MTYRPMRLRQHVFDPTRRQCLQGLAVGCTGLLIGGTLPGRALAAAACPPRLRPDSDFDVFVDPDTGNDGNPGTSPDRAWASLSMVERGGFAPGTRIGLKRGALWREDLRIGWSGAPDKPMLIGAYGDGPAPQIVASVVISSGWERHADNIWYRDNISWQPRQWFADGTKCTPQSSKKKVVPGGDSSLEDVRKPGDWWYDEDAERLYIYDVANPNERRAPGIEVSRRPHPLTLDGAAHVVVEDLHVRHSQWGNVGLRGGASHCVLDRIESEFATSNGLTIADANHNVVRDCEFHHNGQNRGLGGATKSNGHGIDFSGGGGTASYNLIVGGSCHHNAEDSIQFNIDQVHAENNTIRDHWSYSENEDGYDFKSCGQTGTTVIEGCLVENNANQGITFHALCVAGAIIRRNIVRNCRDSGIRIRAKGTWRIEANLVHGQGTQTRGTRAQLWLAKDMTYPTLVEIYNNTFVAPVEARAAIVAEAGGRIDLRNNIIVHEGRADCVLGRGRIGRLSDHYNLMYRPGGGPLVRIDNSSALGHGTRVGDPLFVAAGRDFHLSEGSPARGAGQSGLVTDDLDGKAFDPDAPNIGAYAGFATASTQPAPPRAGAEADCAGKQGRRS